MSVSTGESQQVETFIDVDIISGDGVSRPFRANRISTTKYTLLTWLPKSIWMQFRRIANIYFLCISILMLIGTYATYLYQTPLDASSTIGTLIVVLLVTSVKEGMEDNKRSQSDSYENSLPVTVVTFNPNGSEVEKVICSQDVCPGDIIKITGQAAVPVDLILVYTSYFNDGNKCYIDTCNLDGETNLKLKEGPSLFKEEFSEIMAEGKANKSFFYGALNAQSPNKNMHKFLGTLNLKDASQGIPLSNLNIILRGSVVSNTDWCYGIAMYTGGNTKIQLNGRSVPTKLSKMEGYLNSAIILIFWAQVLLSMFTTISIYLLGFNNLSKTLPYVYPDGEGTGSILPLWLESFIVFFLLYNNMIPISLYVTIEIVNVGQASMISNDVDLYRKELDVACAVRSSNLVQELGGVGNIFSDKTGTLTRNEMKLVKFVLNGTIYDVPEKVYELGEVEDDASNPKAGGDDKEGTREGFAKEFGKNFDTFFEFCRCLVTCHTVVRESDGTYRAESPDELALVEAVGSYNCHLMERGSVDMSVQMFGKEGTWEVLAVNAFDSDRKRMSVIIRNKSDNSYFLMCKGADSIMMPLCTLGANETVSINKSLFDLSNLGLRTLVIAQKRLTEQEALDWLKVYKEATLSVSNRDELMAAAGGQLEVDMKLIGVTAIEDKLQDEVPEVIADLAKAGIILWMLTGDKLETAINIGRSCNLILDDTVLSRLSGIESEKDWYEQLLLQTDAIISSENPNTALVLDGPSFTYFKEDDLEQRALLLKLAASCRSVIACRLTPTQKKDLVKLVKVDTVPRLTTLSIGDGANDVSMIMEADVGVGIYGKEGRQAANNADIAIGEFKFLRKILLVHGRWNYVRQARVFLYSMHKNIVLTLTLFWFQYFCAVSGTTLYQSYVYAGFNIFLFLPVIIFGMTDRDLSADFCLRHPETYVVGKDNLLIGSFDVGLWFVNSVLYATVICVLGYIASFDTFTYEQGVFQMGTVIYSGMTLGLQLKIAFLHHQWSYPHVVAMIISFLLMIACFYGVSQDEYLGVTVTAFEDYYKTAQHTIGPKGIAGGRIYWMLGFFFIPLACLGVDAIGTYAQWLFIPTGLQLARECENRNSLLSPWQWTSPSIYSQTSTEEEALSISIKNSRKISKKDPELGSISDVKLDYSMDSQVNGENPGRLGLSPSPMRTPSKD